MKKILALILGVSFAIHANAWGFKLPKLPKPPGYNAIRHYLGKATPAFAAAPLVVGLGPIGYKTYKDWRDEDDYEQRFKPIVPGVAAPCDRGGSGGVSPC